MKKILYILVLFSLIGSLLFFTVQPKPQVLVIFGGTGDLAQRKLAPALVRLEKKGELPKEFVCIGIGRRDLTDAQFRTHLALFLDKEDAPFWDSLSSKIVYLQGSIENAKTYESLSEKIQHIHGKPLYYLATPDEHFSPIVENLASHRLIGDSNVVIEKPFGHDLSSAIALQKDLSRNLKEEQIYRIDHYLGKEIPRNILKFRFEHPEIEKSWNNKKIERVSIKISEDIGVGTRGSFFEKTGLLRDVVQNHIIQLAALVGMEMPVKFEAEEIQKEKVRFLESIHPIVPSDVVRGQYGPNREIPGYRQEKGVDPESAIETYVSMDLFVDSERWKGVPFHIEAGKRLSQRFAEIVVQFKDSKELTFRIQPEEKINGADVSSSREAYERLLLEAMQGDRSDFVSFDELLASWRLFTPVLQYWEQHLPQDFPNYPAGSQGP